MSPIYLEMRETEILEKSGLVKGYHYQVFDAAGRMISERKTSGRRYVAAFVGFQYLDGSEHLCSRIQNGFGRMDLAQKFIQNRPLTHSDGRVSRPIIGVIASGDNSGLI